MIKVVSFKICPFVQRVTALLEAKNLAYEVEYISLANKPEWFLKISPNAQVPVLITESGKALFESDAIVEYLDEVHEPLEEDISAEQRAADRAWSYLAAKNYLVQCSAMRSTTQEIFHERSDKLRQMFAKAETALGNGTFFKGDEISNVDIAWLPVLHRAYIILQTTGYDFIKGYPNVQRWQKAIINSGLAEKSVANDFETAFTKFYLSEETFLGCCHVHQCDFDVKCAENCC